MNTVLLAACAILTTFYASFFIKMFFMKREGIDINLLGKGDKPARARRLEELLKTVTFAGAPLQFISVLFSGQILGFAPTQTGQVIGLSLAGLGTVFFIAAMTAMKNNWRSGCDQNQKTALVLSGPYKISRNPAFVGFDLLYIGCALAFPNIFNLIISGAAVVIFHRQILEEERFLEATFGPEYLDYKSQVKRYLGRWTRP